ncbi:MAG: ABC transporter ATP-binding protein, partial [Lachnospiraceae bacterium]|nr:ABC transporter ATP-binding protein [Lachnospiraceae bacterium]
MKQLSDVIKKSIKTGAYFYSIGIKKKRSYLLVVILSILISSAAPFINMIGPKMIIEELMGAQDKIRLMIYAAAVISGNFIAAALLKILGEIRTMQEDELSRGFELKMSDKAMHIKYELTESEEALSAHQKAETGMSWYSGGIKGLSDCIVGIGTSIFVVIGVITIVVRVSPLLLLLSFTAVLVNSFCSAKIYQAAQEVFEKTPAINKFYTYIYTRITGREYAKELRLYDAGELIERKSVENANALNRMDNECARKQFAWGVPGSIMSVLSYGITYCYLGIMALKGSISIAEFVMCITAVETFTNNGLLLAINNIQQLIMKCNFMKAFIEYMELEDGSYTGEQSPDMESYEGIVFDNVSFKYPGTEEYILKDINLAIHKGERISIVGLNGAGKSTLVKLICRLYDVTEGSIRLCGRDIREYSFEEYIKQLSVVFQDFKLFGYSIDENIRMGDP